MTPDERETTVSYTDADEHVTIHTCRRADITALKKKLGNGVTLHREGIYTDGTAWAQFQIPRSRFSISKCLKTSLNLTAEQRAARSERVAAARSHHAK